MRSLEDKIIKDKLDSLDFLPGGYEPRLESKWELLEQGLDGNRRVLAITWSQMAVAALALMIAGGVWMSSQKEQLPVSPVKFSAVEKVMPPPAVVEAGTLDKKVVTHARRYVARPALHLKSVVEKETVAQRTEIAEAPMVQEQPQETVTHTELASVLKPKKRFVEIDFNEAPASKAEEPVYASQAFKFRLNLGQGEHAGGEKSNSRFQKSISIN